MSGDVTFVATNAYVVGDFGKCRLGGMSATKTRLKLREQLVSVNVTSDLVHNKMLKDLGYSR